MKTQNYLFAAKFAIDTLVDSNLQLLIKDRTLLNDPHWKSEQLTLARLAVAIEDNNFTEADSDLLTQILIDNHDGFYNM